MVVGHRSCSCHLVHVVFIVRMLIVVDRLYTGAHLATLSCMVSTLLTKILDASICAASAPKISIDGMPLEDSANKLTGLHWTIKCLTMLG
eukprot:2072247-Amphidinium_carterae.1